MPRRLASPAPQPLLLGAAGHTCVAWWHAPGAGSDVSAAPPLPRHWLPAGALPLAVVLAGSWGEEDMSAYDGLRELAIRLAEGGIGTLRFEWPDTGDSSAATGSTSIADALAAFDAAATHALALSGCERLAFAGLRFGALLAAHAAVARPDVDALVALLPVASGRAFVREQRMLGAGLKHSAAPMSVPGAAFDAADLPVMLGGFAQTVRHAEALSVLKWPSAATTSVLEALLLWPPESPGRAAADALARMGVRVREWAHEALSTTLAVSHQARLAPVAIDEIVRWLQERADDRSVTQGVAEIADFGRADDGNMQAHAALAASRLASATSAVLALSAADAPVWMRLREAGVALRERIVQIGEAGDTDPPCLAGVLCETDSPNHESVRPGRRGIVLLSSGRERRVGPHRLWVPWARRRAALGDVVLRLDIAGIGDSAPRARKDPDGTSVPYDPRAVDDIARALAWLRREHAVESCTVMGVCSGAHHAWRAAVRGVDVQQVVALNPLIFHWKRGMSLDPRDHAFGQIAIAADAGRSLLDPERWWKLLTGRANVGVITGALAARTRHAFGLRLREFGRLLRWPLQDDLAAEMARVCGRGVVLDFVFSFREPGLTLMREQAGRRGMRLVRDSLVKVCEIAHADHTFAGSAGRAKLYARLDSLLLTAPPMRSPSVAASSRQTAVLHT